MATTESVGEETDYSYPQYEMQKTGSGMTFKRIDGSQMSWQKCCITKQVCYMLEVTDRLKEALWPRESAIIQKNFYLDLIL